MRVISLISCLFILCSHTSFSQKVKYKDIFPDLEARKFNKVEPQLRSFLADEKNQDHPNANYQMGLIVEAKFTLQDIVADTATLFTLGTEAVELFGNALTYITEKELKKNEKYYQAFFRRDLRTGEFGIKISDVHLEIEKKIEGLNTKMQAVRDFHSIVGELEELESQCIEQFNNWVSTTTSFDDYLMKAEIDMISELGDLQALAREFDEKAKQTLEIGEILSVTDYYSSIEKQSIGSFAALSAIFPQSNTQIKTYNFSDWASETKSLLNERIFTMKDELGTLDQKLNQDYQLVRNGQNQVQIEAVPKALERSIQEFDRQSVALEVLRLKRLRNTVLLLSDTTLNRDLLDSSLVVQQVRTSDSIMSSLQDIVTRSKISSSDLSRADTYYGQYFTDAFDGKAGVDEFLKDTRTWAQEMMVPWDTIQAFWDLRNNWGLTENDTIHLRRVEEDYMGNYMTNGSLEFPGDTIISWGIKADSLVGFVAKFGPDRRVVWESRFESEVIKEGKLLFYTDTITTSLGEHSFFLYDEEGGEEKDLAVVNFSDQGEIIWSVTATAHKKPEYTVYAPTVQEVTIFLYPQEAYPLPSGELGYLVINRKGEVR